MLEENMQQTSNKSEQKRCTTQNPEVHAIAPQWFQSPENLKIPTQKPRIINALETQNVQNHVSQRDVPREHEQQVLEKYEQRTPNKYEQETSATRGSKNTEIRERVFATPQRIQSLKNLRIPTQIANMPQTPNTQNSISQKDVPLTVIVPVFNNEENLEDCIKSLLLQDLPGMQIFCIDDGSEDGCGEIIKNYAAKYPQIRSFYQENSGVSVARNVGIDNATSEYVAFADGDDFLVPGAYKMAYEVAKENNADVVAFGANFYEEDYGRTPCLKFHDHVYVDDTSYYKGEKNSWISTCNKLFKRSLINQYHIRFNNSLKCGEDDLFNNMVFPRAHVIAFMFEELYNIRVDNAESATNGRYTPFERKIFCVKSIELTIKDWAKFGGTKSRSLDLFKMALNANVDLFGDYKGLTIGEKETLSTLTARVLNNKYFESIRYKALSDYYQEILHMVQRFSRIDLQILGM